jgi:BirA family biotin operon repressor/biotin-[acetyl-CoA-carboxylase] ligase
LSSAIIQQLAGFLSATETRSGEAIGHELGCSRTAVWKHVENLRALGIEVDAVAGQGYRLREPLELLDRVKILAAMDSASRGRLRSLRIESSLDSTNAAVRRLAIADQHATVIIAEHQTGGRGRRGRQWHSPYARNLYLSMGWMFDKALSELGCLPLVVALATARTLERMGLEGHRVKWPNDITLESRKLCGCLVEVQGDSQGPCHAVLGIGINVHMPETALTGGIDQPWTDLHSRLPGCSRNTLAGLLLEELMSALERFSAQGFSPFNDTWEQWDGLRGRTVAVMTATGEIRGTAVGIDTSGALLLDTGGEVLKLHAGDVSLSKTKI